MTNFNYNLTCYDAAKMLFLGKRNERINARSIKHEYYIMFNDFEKIHQFMRNEFKCDYNHSNLSKFYFNDADNILMLLSIEDEENFSAIKPMKVSLEVNADYYFVEEILKDIVEKFNLKLVNSSDQPIAKWAYKSKGEIEYTNVKTKLIDNLIPELYPFINNVSQYINNYINSSQNILILTGEPGLGKTSFIKYILKQTGWVPTITYDSDVSGDDNLYIDFINSSQSDVLILEDADLLLKSRLDSHNKIMSKILNVSDGLINFSGKKFIFTANIENIRDIDSALIRPGRCYDVLKFRMLTREEALKAAEIIGIDLEIEKSEYSVAEIFMNKTNEDNHKHLPSRFGFGFGINA